MLNSFLSCLDSPPPVPPASPLSTLHYSVMNVLIINAVGICHAQLQVDCKSWLSLFPLNAYLLILLGHQLMKVLKNLELFRYFPLLFCIVNHLKVCK